MSAPKYCTKLKRRWKYVEIDRATVRMPARWGRIYYFEHCGRPAIGHREATAWCAGCVAQPAKEE